MGAKVNVEQQEDLGIVARAALRHALNKQGPASATLITSAVAHLVPLLSESDIRQLMWDVDAALSDPANDKHAWADLMVVLRRVDRP